MAGVTDTQSLRFGQVTDVITHTMIANLADDFATKLDAVDAVRAAVLRRPVAWARKNNITPLAVNTQTTVAFDTKLADTHGMIDLVGQPTRITATSLAGPGFYVVEAAATCDSASWTRGDISIFKDGAVAAQRTLISPVSLCDMTVTAIIWLGVVTDFLDMRLYHEGGGTTNALAGQEMRVFKIANN